jgi:RNA recognition motif-containing protein
MSTDREPEPAEGTQVYLGNLSYETTEGDIEKLFGKCGPISKVNLPMDR